MARVLVFILVLPSLVACSLTSPKGKTRQDLLRDVLRSFHLALISQDIPAALRCIPPEDRGQWNELFACSFKRLRLLDYRIEQMQVGEKAKEAEVRARWSGHRLDSLVVEDFVWEEDWSFRLKERRWFLVSAPDGFVGLPEDCSPGERASAAFYDPGRSRSVGTI